MDRYCVMGNPVEHSKSPWIHARFAELTGHSLQYGKRLVPLDGFVQAVAELRAEGGLGCNITVPFKFEAARLAQHESARARLAGASNFLHFRSDGIYADNTDGAGLVNDIQSNAGVALAGRDVLLIGAGGASAGVLGPLIEAQVGRITVANRTLDKARALVERHAALARQHGVRVDSSELAAVQSPYDVVVNATASSLSGAGVPVSPQVLKPGALALDMMYGPAAAGFMDWARAHQAVPRDGLGMLVEQAAEAFLLWRGVRPPSARVLAELRSTLA
ncbi:shikimate dehydrogenase [Rhodoferax sp. OV413]|uniref:shikimate dehydrogenase n=1 Tax=Rhodoferax sp. OV413 TaxID=1855285 RepID=UPI000890A154|nr:shikimate dehydrogenase [Rhodoferax sp. OV413]SDP93697.1 shikimate dehydrogenase [Rhodoferax sp. OV413]